MPLPFASLLTAGGASRAVGAASQGGNVASAISKISPHLDDEVQVTVTGQPGSSLRDLYYLGLSAAFGTARRFDAAQWMAPPPGLLMCEYSMGTEPGARQVRVTLRMRTSMLSSTAAAQATNKNWKAVLMAPAGGGLVYNLLSDLLEDNLAGNNKPDNNIPLYTESVIYTGPRETVVGGEFNFTGYLSPGLPNSPSSRNTPKLPFTGKVLVSSSPDVPDPNPNTSPGTIPQTIVSPNPKPPADNRSRSVVGTLPQVSTKIGSTDFQVSNVKDLLVSLVYASLSDPGSAYLMTSQPPTLGPQGS
jgi:hypothetical protein